MLEQQAQWDYPELTRGNISTPSAGLNTGVGAAMPYYWTSDDTRRAIVSSLIPVGVGAIGVAALSQDSAYHRLLETTRRPHWTPSRNVFSALDVLTTAPFGYASYLVYKYGGGFDYTDTTIALGLYGTTLGVALAAVPLVKARNLKGLWINATLLHLASAATAFAFYKVDKNAGYLMLPFVAWSSFYAYFSHAVHDLNPSKLD
ncbi:hypothetical protein M3Y99_01655200 [Aphelenchoides fujianensis]|nr:hypothetical protein M3Y99_01655200 [Aphelenchoides fujianensis]